MEYPYFTFTVPIFIKMLSNIDHLLEKAEAYVAEKGMPEAEILSARLAPDMFHFTKQVQISCDHAKGAAARLSGATAPVMEDTEASLRELRDRVAKTIAYLKTVTPEQFANAATQKVVIPYFKNKHFIGHEYLLNYVFPNFFFHVTTTYNILRAKGVPLGKDDYVGILPLKDGE